jgi:hypothetical protein
MVSPPTRRPGRRWWLIPIALGVILFGVVTAIVISTRVKTGKWDVPDADAFRRTFMGKDRPTKTVFLERGPIELRPGTEDAPRGLSSVLARARNKPTKMPGWKSTDVAWKRLVACVTDLFAPFDVKITDRRPREDDFILVAVGGHPRDIGYSGSHASGLAPFDGNVVPRAVVYAFSAALENDVLPICETIGQEVAHAYGLDHAYECKDLMTYLPACGPKKFVNKAVQCGERKPRACPRGEASQNSFRHLMEILGPKINR